MAITFVSSSANDANPGTAVTVTEPASVAENDLYLAFVTIMETTKDGTLATPSGWTQIAQKNNGATNFGTGGGTTALFYTRRGASALGSTEFTYSGSTGPIRASILAYRGVSTTTAIDVSFADPTHVNALQDDCLTAAQPITTVTNDALVVLAQWHNQGPTTAFSPPSGYTSNYSVSSTNRNQIVASKTVATAGTETPGAWGHTVGGSQDSIAFTIALRPAAGGTTYSLSTQPLYYGATLLASKTNIEFSIKSGHTGIDGETQASGVNGTTNVSGVFQVPGGYSSSTADDVTLALYWEEGSDPVVDRSLIVKTTLVEDV